MDPITKFGTAGRPDHRAAGAVQREQALRRHAWLSVDTLVACGAAHYCRERDLPRLLPGLALAGPPERQAAAAIVSALKQALLRERLLGRSGHRAYNLVRHMALAQALKAETERDDQRQADVPSK